MVDDNGVKKQASPTIVLIQDMGELYKKTGLQIKEMDDKVIKTIALVQEGKIDTSYLEDLRIELWIKYTDKNIEKIEKFVKELSVRLVQVAEYRKQINEIKRKFISIKNEFQDYRIPKKSQNLDKIINLFNDSTNLWNILADSEEDLRRQAWFNFLSKIYLPFSVIISAGYWAIIEFVLKSTNLQNILFWWGLILFVSYHFLLNLAKNPFKIEEN